jgi:hypothetical protein
MMKHCKNCKKYYVIGNEICLNCGSNAVEYRNNVKNSIRNGVVQIFLFINFILFIFGILLWFGSFDPIIFKIVGRLPASMMFIFGSVMLFVILTNYILGLKIFSLEKFLKTQEFISANFKGSLLYWEEQIIERLKQIDAQLDEMRSHKEKFTLTEEEAESFIQAEKLLLEKKQQADLKLNSFKAARWINAVEYIFYLVQKNAPETTFDRILHKINVRLPEGAAIAKSHLDEDTRLILIDAVKGLENLKTEVARRKSLSLLQGVQAGSETGGNVLENLLTQKDRLQLTEGSMDQITPDMFLKEKFRLEILEILK